VSRGPLAELLCRLGHHSLTRCAGRLDHRWRWSTKDRRWVATTEHTPPTSSLQRRWDAQFTSRGRHGGQQ